MSENQFLLIVGGSGRMLAQAARNIGFKPLVIDLYNDCDTQEAVEYAVKINAWNKSELKNAVAEVVKNYAFRQVIYGSGVECFPEAIQILEDQFEILGNDFKVYNQTLDKTLFFKKLKKLGIPHPEVSYIAPDNDGNWLVKPCNGYGGEGIRRYNGQDITDNNVFWQREIPGISGSALFLANTEQCHVVGFNTQWQTNMGDYPYLFHGIINLSPLTDKQESQVTQWLQELVDDYKLCGLNSLDFIIDNEELYVLEVNSRPSASLQLYSGKLLADHISACCGRLPRSPYQSPGYSGFQVVYAKTEVKIPERFDWPNECHDLPEPGSIIQAGQPICSILIRDDIQQNLHLKLIKSEQNILQLLTNGQN